MTGRVTLLALAALAALTVAAHAEGPRRDGQGRGEAQHARGYSPPAAYGRGAPGGYGGYGQAPARGYGAPTTRRGYNPPPEPAPVYVPGPARGRGYEPPPAPYEPSAQAYRARPNSLGAQWGQQQDEARRGVSQGLMPLSRVLQNLERLRPGRVLDAGLEPGPDGRTTYRVRWAATGGRRVDFIVDAKTGAIIGRGGE